MTLNMTTLRNDFTRNGFAIVPNLFTRSEVQRLKLECIDILEAVKAETGTVAGHGVHVGLSCAESRFSNGSRGRTDTRYFRRHPRTGHRISER